MKSDVSDSFRLLLALELQIFVSKVGVYQFIYLFFNAIPETTILTNFYLLFLILGLLTQWTGILQKIRDDTNQKNINDRLEEEISTQKEVDTEKRKPEELV